MGGEFDHVMKIEAKETETTARPIAAYGPPRIDSGPDRVYLTPVAGHPRSRFLQRRKVFRPSELSRGAKESMQLSDIQRIAVIGEGTMWAGIAQVGAPAGVQGARLDTGQRNEARGIRPTGGPLR